MVTRRELPIKLEFNLGGLKDRAEAKRQALLMEAAPQIDALRKQLAKDAKLGLQDIDDRTAKATLDFYNKVVADGRYVKLMRTRPAQAADKLGIKVPEASLDAIGQVIGRVGGGDVQGPVEAVIAVAVVIVWARENPAAGVVLEDSARIRTARL